MSTPDPSHARSHASHEIEGTTGFVQVSAKLSRATSTLAASHGIARDLQTRRSRSHGHRTPDRTLGLPLKGEGGPATSPPALAGAVR